MSKLKKDDEKILYHIYKKKYMTNYKPLSISDLISEFIGQYDGEEIMNVINSLVSQGFIVVKYKGFSIPWKESTEALKNRPELVEKIGYELCAPNVEKFTEIKKLLRYRISIDWLKENFILMCKFFWKHFIVTIIVSIIVSALTTYIITKYITPS